MDEMMVPGACPLQKVGQIESPTVLGEHVEIIEVPRHSRF